MNQIKNKIIPHEDLDKIRKLHPDKTIAFCSGCFDIVHSGHAVFFKQCKQLADILVLGIGRDSTLKELKGANRPINPEQNRIHLMASMQNVDYVTLNDQDIKPGKIDFYDVIKKLKPDIFVLNDDDSAIKEKRSLCNDLGIELKLVPRSVPDHLKKVSSTEIMERIKNT